MAETMPARQKPHRVVKYSVFVSFSRVYKVGNTFKTLLHYRDGEMDIKQI